MAQPGYSTSKLGKPLPHPFPSTTTTTYNQARQHLQSVRSRLSHTIQDYLSACKIMQKTCETWNNPSADREQALLSIDAELLALTVEETTMRQARDVLTDTRNRSKMVAPIYSLPSEILARIFSEAACHCTHETNYDNVPPILNPITLSGVCRQWRQIAITYQPLWMHIDLVVGRDHTEAGYFSPEIWKDRSGGAQLSVHVHQYPSHTDDDMDDEDSEDEASDDYVHPAPMFERLLSFLSVLAPQICSLKLVLSQPTQYILARLLDLWSSQGTIGRAKVLQLHSHLELPELDFHSRNLAFTAAAVSRNPRYKWFFESLEVLHLHNVIPSWSRLVLHNLVDLRLKAGVEWTVTQTEFTSLLTSCSKLQHLTLDSLQIEDSIGQTQNVATLSELRALRIRDRSHGLLMKAALTLIHPGLISLTMSIAISFGSVSSSQNLAALHSFVGRFNVKTLYVSNSGFSPPFASQLGPLPHVKTLVLNHGYLSDTAWVYSWVFKCYDSHPNPHPIDLELPLWPSLKNLYLNRCVVDKDHARRLLSRSGVESIYLWNCFDSSEPSHLPESRPPTPEEYWHFLSDFIPKVKHFNGRWGDWPSLLH